MNNNMTDILEQYIKSLFNEATEDHIIIKRSNVAQKFDCVPSQLNYVIKQDLHQNMALLLKVNVVVEDLSELQK